MGMKERLQKAAGSASETKPYDKVFTRASERAAFRKLAERKMAADIKKKEAEAELEEIKDLLLLQLLQSGEERLGLWDGYIIKVGRGATADKIDGQKLLEKGVALQTILDCTIEGRPTEFAQVVPPKEGK